VTVKACREDRRCAANADQRQPIPDGRLRYAEAGGNFGNACALLDQAVDASNWSAGCMATRTTFSARDTRRATPL
jgi:hypothetical protein